MNTPLISCIPNLSEGRDLAGLMALAQQLKRETQLLCVDWSADADHHRSVWTLAGHPQELEKGLGIMMEWACKHIDLRQHSGIHPRLGALDVIPLVPLLNISERQCIEWVSQLASKLSERWEVPFYLYEKSAPYLERQSLPQLRKGGLQGLQTRLEDPHWWPDFGENSIPEHCGVSTMGVRNPLVAWNVWLNSHDLKWAQQIAWVLREQNGGFKGLRTLGLWLPSHNHVQISMNLIDIKASSIYTIFAHIRSLCESKGVAITGTELLGLVPQCVLSRGNPNELQLFAGHHTHILEDRLKIPVLEF